MKRQNDMRRCALEDPASSPLRGSAVATACKKVCAASPTKPGQDQPALTFMARARGSRTTPETASSPRTTRRARRTCLPPSPYSPTALAEFSQNRELTRMYRRSIAVPLWSARRLRARGPQRGSRGRKIGAQRVTGHFVGVEPRLGPCVASTLPPAVWMVPTDHARRGPAPRTGLVPHGRGSASAGRLSVRCLLLEKRLSWEGDFESKQLKLKIPRDRKGTIEGNAGQSGYR